MSKEKFQFVDFTFSIPARGRTEEELRDFAIRELEIDHYDIWKDLLRNPEYAKLGEVIDEVEAPDYGFELEEE
tara:strand:- start:80 stop:298 length:219 start_codon:yes stop_codon:yes gene_type:complete